jgi:hypothetical protein
VSRIGTVGEGANIPRLGTVSRMGTLGQVTRLGSVGRVGSVVRVGTIGRVNVIGSARISAGSVGRVGYVGRTGTLGERSFAGSTLWDRRHTAVGSTYVGSWQYIAPYYVKTIAVLSSMAGSAFIIVGATGTGPTRQTGTLNRTDLGAGTFASLSFTEQYQYVRPIIRVGSVGSGKGSLSVSVVKQA